MRGFIMCDYRILIPENAGEEIRFAAEELQTWLAEAVGNRYGITDNGSTICIPKVYYDIDMTCRILEDMAYLSMEYVRPAYYETSLERKYTRDSDSQEMLEIIFNNITYDLSYVIDLPINDTMRQLVNNNTTDFTSKFVAGVESYKAKLQKIEKTIEQQ